MKPFGATLKQRREAQKKSLEDVALATKIGVRFLKALEDEEFNKLPGGVFAKSFARTYARELGLNEEEAIASYLNVSGGPSIPEPDLQQIAAVREREQMRQNHGSAFERLPWGVISAVLVVAAIALAIWGSRTHEEPHSPAIAAKNAVTSAASQAVPAPVAKADPSASPTPSPTDAVPVASPAPTTQSVSEAAPGNVGFEVMIKAKADAWISITADGQKLMEDTLAAQTEKAIPARSQVVIRTGNVGALEFSFSGKKLPPQGAYGETRTLTFDSNGLQPSLRQAAITN